MQQYHPKTEEEFVSIMDKYMPDRKKCIYCGGEIYYDNTKVTCGDKVKEPYITCGPGVTKIINGNTYSLCVCQRCLESQCGIPKNYSHIFNSCNPFTIYAFNIKHDDAVMHGKQNANTLDNMIRMYGECEGKKRWESYCNKQSITNTYDYKKKKYGWTVDDYDEYNKSRAVTLNNLIDRYGEEIGKTKWDSYIEKQKYTKSFEYLSNKYGVEKAKDINKSKTVSLNKMIELYGIDEGTKKYEDFIRKKHQFYSDISQKFFNELDKYLSSRYTTYYATKNGEWFIHDKNYPIIYLDYFIKELNICVEFNGEVFHADPRLFEANEYPNPFNKSLTSQDIWDADNRRYKQLKEIHDITTIVVWERDYDDNFNFETFIRDTLNIKL